MALADALTTGDLEAAKVASAEIHHTQHDFSQEVYESLAPHSGEAHDDDSDIVKIEATDWAWTPDTIQLKKDKLTVLEITGAGLLPHGIWIPDLGINVDTPNGKVTLVEITPKKTGEFFLGCNNPLCGSDSLHGQMDGTVIVTD